MREALETAPPRAIRAARYASRAGRYRFYLDRDAQEVEIPDRAIQIPVRSANAANLSIAESRPAIRVSLKELQAEAEWMERYAMGEAAQRWSKPMRALDLREIAPEGLRQVDGLSLDGLLHLAGMLGSGKSSLFTVLAVFLARRGYRVTMVLGDVASLLREHSVFEALRTADPQLHAVPLIGRSTRELHLNRVHRAQVLSSQPSLEDMHPAYRMLSTICPLDGLRRDVDPIPLGSEPCTRLYFRPSEGPSGAEDASHPRDCPLMPRCPVHLPTRELAAGRVWLATPASLLASGPQVPLITEELRNLELVMRYSDVVLIDEADAVQVQFDEHFAPAQVLVGANDAWLDRLAIQVARQVYRPARPPVGRNPTFDRWLTVHNNTQRAVDRLYRWLRETAETQSWLGGTYFSGERLLRRVESDLTAKNVPVAAFAEATVAFARNALGSARGRRGEQGFPVEWISAVRLELLGGDEAAALEELGGWLQATLPLPDDADPRWIEMVAHRLLIALIVSVLEHALQDVIAGWGDAEREIDLDRGSGGLFYQPSDSLVQLVPEAPMGAILGFRYSDPERQGDGELHFFHVRGVGRALLYHLHDAFRASEGVTGPHVLLTSGTSWAPGSWRYHLHMPPNALLLPMGGNAGEVQCFFEPLADPEAPSQRLFVSGRKLAADRIRNLRAMVRELATPRGFGSAAESRLDAELRLLDERRRRILLVVGSYTEAEAVGEALTEALGAAPGEKVVTLIPDRKGDPAHGGAGRLLRSMLPQFADRNAPFLIAPLQAIERGHNILVGHEAAIGSVYFLVRPIPAPGDLHTTIQRINSWAMRLVPTLPDLDIGTAGKSLRDKARRKWDELLAEQETYRGASDRTALLWTQLVLVWQCIGRLLRGGVGARVHFVDGKWAEVTAGILPGDVDTEATSMLLGFDRILREAVTNPDPREQAIAEALYGPFARALAALQGVRRG